MHPGLSLYLDGVRFLLATAVLLGHGSFHAYTGQGSLWFTTRYLQTAVDCFFVLSGFVIAYVSATKEHDLRSYAAARLSRLQSVVIPALGLTAVLAMIGNRIDDIWYHTGPDAIKLLEPLRYALTFLLINSWAAVSPANWTGAVDFAPGTNDPFWSLSYEAAYYAIFAAAIYWDRSRRIIALVGLSALAGPHIMLLMPIWLLGVAAYHVRRWLVPPVWVSAVLFLLSIGALLRIGWLRGSPETALSAPWQEYSEGFVFALNIVSATGLARHVAGLLTAVAPVIRVLGAMTFSLYLCHRPLLHFFSLNAIAPAGSLAQTCWLFGWAFGVTALVTYLSDTLRRRIRLALLQTWGSGQVRDA
jgi:peptidoglycan/LPS O-acetylase OafA/YrhL